MGKNTISEDINWLKDVWPKADFSRALALDGVHVARNDEVLAGGDRVFLVLSPKLSKLFLIE